MRSLFCGAKYTSTSLKFKSLFYAFQETFRENSLCMTGTEHGLPKNYYFWHTIG